MRKIILSALVGTAALAASPAFAQEQSSAQGFSGGHIEAITGYDHISDGAGGGILYGIGAGYDYRTRNAVVGIEGEVLESTTGDCQGNICADASRDFYIGGRVGAVVAPNVLLYGKIGYTNARVQASVGNVTTSTNLDGVRAGAGMEWLIPNSPLSIRAEYRYSNYEQGVERHQGTLGLAFRF
ncbi:outer membrane protein [Allosphingosinicella sp.]|uniref:outer membrane protein n=1 Tax=Allosphingosinicella sp. TaxID=2823234 RepID=UPI0037838148